MVASVGRGWQGLGRGRQGQDLIRDSRGPTDGCGEGLGRSPGSVGRRKGAQLHRRGSKA